MKRNLAVFVDLEHAGGKHHEASMLTLGTVVADLNSMEELDSFEFKFRYIEGTPWNPYAEKIHRISKSQARRFPDPKASCIGFLKRMVPYKNEDNSPIPFYYHGINNLDFKICMHNFDRQGLKSSFDKLFSSSNVHSTCTLFSLYRSLKGVVAEGNRLEDMAQAFNIDYNPHDAMDDSRACFLGFKKIASEIVLSNSCY